MVPQNKHQPTWFEQATIYLDGLLSKYGHLVVSARQHKPTFIYVGRGGSQSMPNQGLGNPYPLPRDHTGIDRAHCIGRFELYARRRIQADPEFREKVKSLKGKTLTCYCSNGTNSRSTGAKWCHALVLHKLADELQD